MTTTDSSELLFLSQEDAIEAGATDMERCVEAMIDVFDLYDQDRVAIGQYLHGQMITFPAGLADVEASSLRPGSRFGAMPAYVGGDVSMAGIKWYGSVTAWPDETAAPRSPPLLTLTDPDTGKPLVMMNGAIISTMRTGAMAGVGAKYLQGDRAEVASIIGPGRVGQAASLGLDATLDSLEELYITHPDESKAEAFAEKMAPSLTVDVTPTDSIEEAVSSAEVTVTAASRDPAPRIEPSWLPDDSTVIQLGDLNVPLDAFDDDRLFCDIREHPLQFDEQVGWEITGEFTAAVEDGLSLSSIRTLYELVGGTDTGPTEGKSLLSSLGLPMEDVTWGTIVYRNAVDADLGQTLTLASYSPFDKPY